MFSLFERQRVTHNWIMVISVLFELVQIKGVAAGPVHFSGHFRRQFANQCVSIPERGEDERAERGRVCSVGTAVGGDSSPSISAQIAGHQKRKSKIYQFCRILL